jgi:NAD(P)H-dependent flavin oxidoreductase YrpB (nitropropane dioxygenase family)
VTKIYSGLPARVIANRFTRALHEAQDHVVAFPLGMAAVAPLVGASLEAGSSEIAPLWTGQAAGLGQSTGACRTGRSSERGGLGLARLACAIE